MSYIFLTRHHTAFLFPKTELSQDVYPEFCHGEHNLCLFSALTGWGDFTYTKHPLTDGRYILKVFQGPIEHPTAAITVLLQISNIIRNRETLVLTKESEERTFSQALNCTHIPAASFGPTQKPCF